MQTLETDWWSIDIPPEWEVSRELDEQLVVISDKDHVGDIAITSLAKDQGIVNDGNLHAFAKAAEHTGQGKRVTIGDLTGYYYAACAAGSGRDEEFIRQWYLRYDKYLMAISYTCSQAHAGMDDRAVDDILATLRVNT